MSNRNMHRAKSAKNDEFYTRIEDIERELKHYKSKCRGKVVFLNCDDPVKSAFWKYFRLNFQQLGLKKVISTHYDEAKATYKLELIGDIDGDGKVTDLDIKKTKLKGNGDFRNEECIEILKEADIVVTNPPFSLFREYIAQLIEYKKKFLVIGNKNAITYKEIFGWIKDNKLWLGRTSPTEFGLPDGKTTKSVNGLCRWFTNLKHGKRHQDYLLFKKYKGNEQDYPKYDNYNAINVNKVADIPMDYRGKMGVPITFLDHYNPHQFEIVGPLFNGHQAAELGSKKVETWSAGKMYMWNGPAIDGKQLYKRIIIRRTRNSK